MGGAHGRGTLCLLLAACAVTSVFAVNAEPYALNFQVEPQQEVCFLEDVEAMSQIDATVLVYRGGKLDVKLRIEDPSKFVTYEELHFSNIDDSTGALLHTIVRKGSKFLAAKSGTYTFCVDNRMAKWTAKLVAFEITVIRPGSPAPLDAAADAAEAARSIAVMVNSAARIHQKLVVLEHHQYDHYHLERAHRDTAESTNTRVQWYSALESLVIILAVMFQIANVYLKVGSKQSASRMMSSSGRSMQRQSV